MGIKLYAAGESLPAACPEPAVTALLSRRRSPPVHTLGTPGPEGEALDNILKLALRVPDHGKLQPWRLLVFSGAARVAFIDQLFELAEIQARPAAAKATIKKISKVPTTVAVISRPSRGKIPYVEQQLSSGALCMNLLIAAHANGYGAHWLTGWPAYNADAATLLGLETEERITGYIHLGTPDKPLYERPRPELASVVSFWQPSGNGG